MDSGIHKESKMDRVQDPVCGMMLDPDTAVASVTHESREFFFCSDDCRHAFQADPEAYATKAEQEPPYTVTKGVAAPKFGSAGSGGLENEPVEPTDRWHDGQGKSG
jgi:YHS domain-containing protein